MTPNFIKTEFLAEKYSIFETKSWHPAKMREFCEENGYYTRGSNEEYSDFLAFVGNNMPTVQIIYFSAKNIYEHSTHDEYSLEVEEIEALMFKINNEVVITSYSIE